MKEAAWLSGESSSNLCFWEEESVGALKENHAGVCVCVGGSTISLDAFICLESYFIAFLDSLVLCNFSCLSLKC